MTELHIVRIDADTYDPFMALIAPSRTPDGCDLFPGARTEAVARFLAAYPRHIMPAVGGGSIARRIFHPDGAAARLSPVAAGPKLADGNPALPKAAARRRQWLSALSRLIAADLNPDGTAFLRMAELDDPDGEQIAVFHRAGPAQAWSIVHAFAKAEPEYLAELIAHPPVENEPLLRAERWPDGSVTLTRVFAFQDQVFALEMYGIDAGGRVTRGPLPEDRNLDKAVPMADYLRAQAAKRGGQPRRLDPSALDLSGLLAGQPARFTLIKYMADPKTILGAAVAPAEAERLLAVDAAEAAGRSLPAAPLLRLLPLSDAVLPLVRDLVAHADGGRLPADALLRLAASQPALSVLPGSRGRWWTAAAFADAPGGDPSLDAPAGAAASAARAACVEATQTSAGLLKLTLSAGRLPWPGLLAVWQPRPGDPPSAMVVMDRPGADPAWQAFGPAISGLSLRPPADQAAAVPAAPPPPPAPTRRHAP